MDSFIRACARCIGACTTGRLWLKQRSNTRLTPARRYSCGTGCNRTHGRLKFPAQAELGRSAQGKRVRWPTTPWTLPASMAVAFHPTEEYVAIETHDAIYIVAEKLAKSVAEKCGFPD